MKTIYRRRREQKTNYLKRLKFLKSGTPRVVLRRTNKYFIAQYVESFEAKDSVKVGLNSSMLLSYGWPKTKTGSLKSIPAAYLTGVLMGKKIQESKLTVPIMDLGLQRVLAKSRLQSFIKGLVDSGLDIAHRKEVLPATDRVEGKHMKDIDVHSIKSTILGK